MTGEDGDRLFRPVRIPLQSQEVARRLADAIRTGLYRVGSRLPSERSLAEQMQLSRPTIREAVKLLVEAGILSVRPGAGGGTFVSSEIVPLDLMGDIPDLRPGEIGDALELRRLILPWVVQTASLSAEDDDVDRMREAIAFGRDALPPPSARAIKPDHVQAVIIATMRFDLAMARATRNRLVVQLMELLLRWVEPMRPRTLRTREDLVRSVALIETMLASIERADPDFIADITEQRLVILEQALEAQTGRRMRRGRGAQAAVERA